MPPRFSPAGSADKHLCPIIPAGAIAHADLRIGRVEDVGAMAAGIHPGVHNGGGRPLPVGDVFPGSAIGEAKGPDHLERSAIGGAGVGKVPVIRHILRFVPGNPGQFPVRCQRFQPIFCADLVHQPDHFILIIEDRVRNLWDAQDLPRIDQIGVGDLRVGRNDFAGADLIFDRQLPHRVPLNHGVAQAGRGRRHGERCGQERGGCQCG